MLKNSAVRGSFDGKTPPRPTQESEFLPSLGNNAADNKTSHGRNHKESETLPIKPINKFKKNELTSSVLDDEFDLDDF